MSRVHDMGGRFGDGPVIPDAPDADVFDKDWHGRALAVTLASGFLGQWNIDVSRHARECLSPKDYMRFSYYEKWMGGLAALLEDTGVVSREELAKAMPDGVSDLASRRVAADQIAGVLAKGGPADRPSDVAPVFNVGDRVQTRTTGNPFVDGGHTRLPMYARGKTGRIVAYHGTHVLPDSNAHRLGEAPEPLYAVSFRASDLWDAPENPEDEVILDLWQSYISAA